MGGIFFRTKMGGKWKEHPFALVKAYYAHMEILKKSLIVLLTIVTDDSSFIPSFDHSVITSWDPIIGYPEMYIFETMRQTSNKVRYHSKSYVFVQLTVMPSAYFINSSHSLLKRSFHSPVLHNIVIIRIRQPWQDCHILLQKEIL